MDMPAVLLATSTASHPHVGPKKLLPFRVKAHHNKIPGKLLLQREWELHQSILRHFRLVRTQLV
jgi:hypothetical protein